MAIAFPGAGAQEPAPVVRLHVARRGEGSDPPTLLLHGFTGSSEAWGESLLEELSRRRTVLAVDLPGHGRSALPSVPDALDFSFVLDALEKLLDQEGVERADWVGYSMGGRIALGAAALRPRRVRRLVLEGASPGLETLSSRSARARKDEALARQIQDRGLEWFVGHWMSLPLFRSQATLPSRVIEAERRRRMANDAASLAAALRGLGTGNQPSLWPMLRTVFAPTLLLTGSLDRKYEALARQMARALPQVRRRSVAGVGHTVHLEAPERWLKGVISFTSPRDRG